MSVKVRIPTPLRSATDGEDLVTAEGETVEAVLTELAETYPEIKARIFNDDGEVHRFINVFVNEEDVRFLDGYESEVSDGDVISIIPAMAGG